MNNKKFRNSSKHKCAKYVVCLASAFVAESALADGNDFSTEYEVEPGDNLSLISVKLSYQAGRISDSKKIYATLVSEFKKNGRNPDDLDIGEKIAFSYSFENAQDISGKQEYSGPIHVIQKGETLYEISKRYFPSLSPMGKSGGIEKLLKLNQDIFHEDRVLEGLVIKVPSEIQVYALNNKQVGQQDDKQKYVVKFGDTVSNISNTIVGKSDVYGPSGVIEYIKILNPQIENFNIVREGLVMRVPTALEYFRWRSQLKIVASR